MTEVDRAIARGNEILDRSRQRLDAPKRRRGAMARAARATKYAIIGAGAILLGGLVWGMAITPLGVTGIMIIFLAMLAAMCLGVALSREPDVQADALGKTELKALPDRTGRWLESQRKALPAPAQSLADSIGVRLDVLAPQLAMLDEREPAAGEIRRLIANELPELVSGYQRVPANLRREGLNGLSPDKQLVEGLTVVESELKRMSEQLAAGDLNKVATQARYLELKYQGDSAS
jgi:hypothetical protein